MTTESATPLTSWPQPNTVAAVNVFANEHSLILRYDTGDDAVAIIEFTGVTAFKLGAPNDEAHSGHPLAKFGLQYYCVHRVNNSVWIADLERQNSVHPRHDKKSYLKDRVHYIFTFQDSTFECVVREDQFSQSVIEVCPDYATAKIMWSNLITRLSV